IARKRWCDDIKGIGWVTTMCRRISQRVDDLHEFIDRAWPSVRDDQWQRLRSFAALVNVMNALSVNRDLKVRPFIEFTFVGTPVVLRTPVVHKLFDIRE